MVHLEGHSLVHYANQFFVFGGKDHVSGQMSNTVFKCEDCDVFQARGEIPRVDMEAVACTGVPPSPRCYHGCCLRGQFMVVVGGVTAGGPHSDAEATAADMEDNMVLYSLNLDTFIWGRYFVPGVLGSMHSVPRPRCHATLTSSPESILLYGGFPADASMEPEESSSALRKNTANEEGAVGFNPESLADLAGANASKAGTLAPNQWQVFQISGQAEVRPIPVNGNSPMLWGHTANFIHGNLILFGGIDTPSMSEVSSVCVFNTNERRWRWVEFPCAPEPRALHSAVVHGVTVIVFGGFTGQNFSNEAPQFNDVWSFSLNTGLWEENPCSGEVPPARSGHAAACVDQKMVVFGGLEGNSVDLHENGTCAVLDLSNYVWRTMQLRIPDFITGRIETPGMHALMNSPAQNNLFSNSVTPQRVRSPDQIKSPPPGEAHENTNANAGGNVNSPPNNNLAPTGTSPASSLVQPRRGFVRPPSSVKGAAAPGAGLGANASPPSSFFGNVPAAAASGSGGGGGFGSLGTVPPASGSAAGKGGGFTVPPAVQSSQSPARAATFEESFSAPFAGPGSGSKTFFDTSKMVVPPAPVGKKHIGPDPQGVTKLVSEQERLGTQQQMEDEERKRQELIGKYIRSPHDDRYSASLADLQARSLAIHDDEQLTEEWWTTPAPPEGPNPKQRQQQQQHSQESSRHHPSGFDPIATNRTAHKSLSETLSMLNPQSVKFVAVGGEGGGTGSPQNMQRMSSGSPQRSGGYTIEDERLFSPEEEKVSQGSFHNNMPTSSYGGGRGSGTQQNSSLGEIGFQTSDIQFKRDGNSSGRVPQERVLSPFVALDDKRIQQQQQGSSPPEQPPRQHSQAQQPSFVQPLPEVRAISPEIHKQANAAYRKRMGLNPAGDDEL